MTDNIDRRKFIKTAVGTAVGAVVAANLPAQAGEQGSKTAPGTEKIFLGGTIITMDDGRREVEAVAIAGGRILAAGDEAEVMKTGTEATEIVDLGGKTLMPVVQVNGRGDFAIFSDPAGALFGIARSDSGDPADFQSRLGDWIWIQLAVKDSVRSADFYAAVGGYDKIARWDVNSDDDLLLSAGGYARAGVSRVDDDRPAVWVPFVRVTDAADAAARAQSLGATLLLPPRDDVPGGDLAVIADPTGAVVGLMTWNYEEATE